MFVEVVKVLVTMQLEERKAVLQEQSQWLKAVLERSSLGVAAPTERRCCDLRRRGRRGLPAVLVAEQQCLLLKMLATEARC